MRPRSSSSGGIHLTSFVTSSRGFIQRRWVARPSASASIAIINLQRGIPSHRLPS